MDDLAEVFWLGREATAEEKEAAASFDEWVDELLSIRSVDGIIEGVQVG